jgi:hypothetical protein
MTVCEAQGGAVGASAAVRGSGAGGGGIGAVHSEAARTGAAGYGTAGSGSATGSAAAAAGSGSAAGSGAAGSGAAGSGVRGNTAERTTPHPAQNLCSAAILGVPQLGQNPNPIVIWSLPLGSTGRASGGHPVQVRLRGKVFAATRSALNHRDPSSTARRLELPWDLFWAERYRRQEHPCGEAGRPC